MSMSVLIWVTELFSSVRKDYLFPRKFAVDLPMIFPTISDFMADLVTGPIFRRIRSDPRLFFHAGIEFYSDYFRLFSGTHARGYFTYDVKVLGEAGGVVDQTFELGMQWRWKKTVINLFVWPLFITRAMAFMASFINCRIIIWTWHLF
jgi:hypothetical protein